ncbi:hypothetical protein ACQKFO_10810 [Rossellomorea sp. NPDC071047]|uniref:hypothetical protein n=1 Tax=Rossellomorea sp. NPDC071047 TaxID=3390675 RepID=UPI003D01D7AE
MQFVKMIRFDQNGFTSGPLKSDPIFKGREPVFINREIDNLFHTGQSIYPSEMIQPRYTDRQWSGCSCYLEEFTQVATETRHIGFLPRESVIWVRNKSHLGGGIPYFNRFFQPLVEKATVDDTLIIDTWVKMTVEDALERTYLWKKEYGSLPDWITECYLMEEQVKRLVYPSASEKTMEFWLIKN